SAFSPFPDGDVESNSSDCSRFTAADAAQPTGMLQSLIQWTPQTADRSQKLCSLYGVYCFQSNTTSAEIPGPPATAETGPQNGTYRCDRAMARVSWKGMSFADPIVIFLLALILFGPKKLPEIGRQIGKLMAEFRRASNEFKSQIDEELRAMEHQEHQKKLEATTTAETPALAAPEESPSYDEAMQEIDERASRHASLDDGSYEEDEDAEEALEPVILPPSTGETVSTERPFMPAASPELLEAAEANPHPVYAEALAAEQNGSSNHIGPEPESAQATVNHG